MFRFEIVSNVTDDYDHITFAWTSDKDVAAQFGIKQHGVFTVKYALPDRLNKHEGKVSHESLIFFLDHYGNPLVMEYGEVVLHVDLRLLVTFCVKETTMIIFEKEYKMQVHLLLPDPKDEKEREKINKILKEFMDAAGKTERGKTVMNQLISRFVLNLKQNAFGLYGHFYFSGLRKRYGIYCY